MAKGTPNRISNFLTECRLLIEGALAGGPAAELLALCGYDQKALEAGQALYDRASALMADQIKEYGDQYQATAALDAAWTEADAQYGKTVKLARVAFRDDVQAQGALMLAGIRPQSLGGWLEQVEVFYRNLLSTPRFWEAIARFGLTREKLMAGQALVQAVADRKTAQRKETSEAQEATEQRDAAMKALDRWAQDFRAVAKVALADRPQLLEGLGIRA